MNWPLLRLGELAAPTKGSIKIGPFGSQLKRGELVGDGVHVLGIENVLARRFDGLGDRYVTEEKYRTLQSVEVLPGDLLITMMGTIGEVSIVPPGTSRSIMDSHLLRFRPNLELCLPEFVAWIFRGPATRSALAARAHGAIMQGLNSGIIRALPVRLPPPSEQRRIVELLDQAEALRRLRSEADGKADRILPSIFLTMFGDSATTPRTWETGLLGDISYQPQYGTSKQCHYEQKGLPVLRIPNVVRGEIDWKDLKYGQVSERERVGLALARGDILFVRTNGNPDYVGRCAVFDDDREALFASYLIRVRLNNRRLDPWFLAAYLRTAAGRRAMAPHIRTTAGQSNISATGIRQLRVPCPPLPLQERFREFVREGHVRQSRARDSAARLDALVGVMLRKAFDGSLTSQWREGHLEELLRETEQQARQLAALPASEALA